MNASTPAISVNSLSKTFDRRVLQDISFTVQKGEFVALIGPSGSGKSTLMRHLSGLVVGDKNGNTVQVLGSAIQGNGKLTKTVRRARQHIGCIFQQFNLVNRLSVLQNVLIGLLGRIPNWRGYCAYFTHDERCRAMLALQRVGMEHLAEQKAGTLSGGQQQRVAIARALMQDAEVILADEPIASLDPKSAQIVMDMLKEINEQDGKTVIVTLHQVGVARKYCKRMIALRDGRKYFDGDREELTNERLVELYGGDVSELLDDEANDHLAANQSKSQAAQSVLRDVSNDALVESKVA